MNSWKLVEIGNWDGSLFQPSQFPINFIFFKYYLRNKKMYCKIILNNIELFHNKKVVCHNKIIET